jgi:hypothetical protein
MSFSHYAHDAGEELSGNDSETDEGSNPIETSTIITNHGIISYVNRLSSLPHSAVVTKRRKVSANAVTPSSGNKVIKKFIALDLKEEELCLVFLYKLVALPLFLFLHQQ